MHKKCANFAKKLASNICTFNNSKSNKYIIRSTYRHVLDFPLLNYYFLYVY